MVNSDPPRVGDRVIVDGWDGEFFVVEVNSHTNSASLLPVGDGRLLKRIPMDSLHGHHDLVN